MENEDQPPDPPNPSAVLNTALLQLSGDIRIAHQPFNCLVVKYQPGRRYLTITAEQWRILREFLTAQKVPQVLLQLLAEQRCPPLREFYDLVIAALAQGILQTEGVAVPPPEFPSAWRLPFRASWVRHISSGLLLVATGLLFWRPPVMPDSPWGALLGWALAGLAVSFGQVLAACVVRGGGGDIYRLRWEWRSPFPGFRSELSDAVMGGRETMAAAALVQLALPMLGAAVAACWWPSAGLVGFGLGWLQFSPLWRSPGREYLRAKFSDPRWEAAKGSIPTYRNLFALLARSRQQFANRAFLLAGVVASLGWLLVFIVGGSILFRIHLPGLLQRFESAGGWHYAGVGLLVLAVSAALAGSGFTLWEIYRRGVAWWRAREEQRRHAEQVFQSPDATAAWLGQTPLFQGLGPADLHAVAAAMKRENFSPRRYVMREGDPGDRLYVVVVGRLAVRRNYAAGRSERVAEISAGDIFGEIALLESGVRTRSVRALNKCSLLSLDRTAFEQLVLSRLSRETVQTAVQKLGFLHHLEFARQWSPAALAAFARRAKFQEFKENEVIIQEGTANHWLFLVYRGEVSVRKKGGEVRRLRQGETFGETSLLRDGIASATVVVVSRSSTCMMMSQADFLGFIAQDYTHGLAFERKQRRA